MRCNRVFTQRSALLAVAALIVMHLFVKGRQAGNSPVLTALAVSGKPPAVVEVVGDVEHPGIYPASDKLLADSVMRMAIPRCDGTFVGAINDQHELAPFGKKVLVVCKANNNGILAYVYPLPAAHGLTLGLPLDVNRATAAELELVPGIGPRLAEKIIQFRQNNGGFGALDELMQVEGIGEVRMQQLYKYFNVQ